MTRPTRKQRVQTARRQPRLGAMLSMELLLVLPVLLILLAALVEFSLIWSANSKVKAASQLGCRVATLPATHPDVAEQVIREKVNETLDKSSLVENHELEFVLGAYTGDKVSVRVRVPMKAVAPDLLSFVGLGLEDRVIVATTVMRKE